MRLRWGICDATDDDRMTFFVTGANDNNFHFFADRRVGHDARQIVHLLDLAIIELNDNIAGLDTSGLRRSTLIDASDERAAWRLDVHSVGDVTGDLLDAQADPPPLIGLLSKRTHAPNEQEDAMECEPFRHVATVLKH